MAIPSSRYTLVTALFAAAAFLLGWEAAISCRFVAFASTAGFSQPVALRFGIWSWEAWTLLVSAGGSTVVYETCHPYDGELTTDAPWKTARAFSIVALVVGGALLLSNLLAACVSAPALSSYQFRFEGLEFLLASIFQGLSLLLLTSSVCKNNALVLQISRKVDLGDFAMEDTCSMDTGARCALAAVVFWFLAGLTSRMASLVEEREKDETTTEPLITGAEPVVERL